MFSFYMILFACLATYTVNARYDGLQKPQKPRNGNFVASDDGLFGVESIVENKKNGKIVGKNNVNDNIKIDNILDKIKPSTMKKSDNLENHENVASDSNEDSAESNESSLSDESKEKSNILKQQGKGNFQHFPTNPQQNFNGYNWYNVPADGRYGNMYENTNFGYNNERFPQPNRMQPPPPPPPPHFTRYQQSYGAPPPPFSPPFSNNYQSFQTPPPPPPMQPNEWNNRNGYGMNWQNNGDQRNQENEKRTSGSKRIRPNNIMMEGNRFKFDQNQKKSTPNSGLQSYNSNIPYNRYNNYENENDFYDNNMYSPQANRAPPSPMSANGLNNHNNNQPKKNQNNQAKNTIKQYGNLVGPLSIKGTGGKVDFSDNGIKPKGKKVPGIQANEKIDEIKETGNLILEDNLNHDQDFTVSGNKSRKITNQKLYEMDQNGNLNLLKTKNKDIISNKPGNNKPDIGGESYGKMHYDGRRVI